MRPARDRWVNPALALCVCAGAGFVFSWLRLPLPWMIGPLAAMALCNLAGAELPAPRGLSGGGFESGKILFRLVYSELRLNGPSTATRDPVLKL